MTGIVCIVNSTKQIILRWLNLLNTVVVAVISFAVATTIAADCFCDFSVELGLSDHHFDHA